MRIIKYSKSEEFLNISTHLLGFILSLIFFLPLVISTYKAGDIVVFMAWLIYFIAIALMFLASSLYHSMTNPLARTIFRAIDHGVIYLTIAGSYTPIILIGLKSTFAIIIFVIIWILAITGISMNIIAFATGKEDRIGKASMIIYMAMGWISVLLLYQIYKYIGMSYLMYLVLGGLFYTIGAVFYGVKKIPYNHAIWHIFILFAAFVMLYGNIKYLG
ncbi:PAQR family membrane homeostasis protein TrhA [Anaerococcus degeneri]|uniref:Hemolysin III family protein n=1 Tax=Anaerococcus degeneri TaxID=361500 RepID=A0ABS7YYN1_9FIRM|nr:hemolysin III family protein [Anaerococcus degeneri]MBP2014614.1 hemolysin III [Anaerococcus degeneri]MCA2096827.1 hemolysin III family protein [Anaerococcus degeneri]